MKCLRITLLVIFLLCAVPRQSDGSFHEFFRKLTEGDNSTKGTDQISPSPSPVPALKLDSGSAQSPVNQQKGQTCDEVFKKCDIKDYNITACVPLVDGSQAPYVLVMNVGESFRTLNMTVSPANIPLKDTQISGHQVEKVSLPSNTKTDSSILVNVENGHCIILLGASIPETFYASYVTPINATYLLFAAALLFGGMWACSKHVKRRHLGKIPYRELEMGKQESNPSNVVETADGWDHNWDDGWDEEKAVTSPGANHNGKSLENGASLKYVDITQWGSDWDD